MRFIMPALFALIADRIMGGSMLEALVTGLLAVVLTGIVIRLKRGL